MVKEQAKESLLISLRKLQDTLENGACENDRIDQMVMVLGKRLLLVRKMMIQRAVKIKNT